jgi:hypothetical protein
VGIGVLIDVHTKGAGLLVPAIAADAFHVWIQFLWFDERMGIQGLVVFVRETPDGFHVGLKLHPLPADTERFLTDVLIPYGLRKFRHDRRHLPAFLSAAFGRRGDPAPMQRQRRYLPVQIEQGTVRVWAVTEERNDLGMVLLLPDPLERDAPVTITTWGNPEPQQGAITQVEMVEVPPTALYRIGVLFVPAPAARPLMSNSNAPDRRT